MPSTSDDRHPALAEIEALISEATRLHAETFPSGHGTSDRQYANAWHYLTGRAAAKYDEANDALTAAHAHEILRLMLDAARSNLDQARYTAQHIAQRQADEDNT